MAIAMSTDFFTALPGFTEFSEVCDPAHYHPAPGDWYIALTDVKGSTQAIRDGRYRDVNMVGAACITAIINCCKGIDIPYVFGGDGATALIPPTHIEQVKTELLAVQNTSQTMHGLSLRVGMVPMKEILDKGKQIDVAKYVMPTGFALAMFRGGGVALADDLVKQGGFNIKVEADEAAEPIKKPQEPNLEGLTCRWEPIPSRNGIILSLLVMVPRISEQDEIYYNTSQKLDEILRGKINPVHLKGLHYRTVNWETLRQSRMVWQQGNWLKKLLNHAFMIWLFAFLHRHDLKLGDFSVIDYREDMISNSDYRKFDDMIRMVVDCSPEQVQAIETYLAERRESGKIVYGTHYSKTALMTCLVQATTKDGHVHFIDGNDGGYAMAARQLKQQLAAYEAQMQKG